MKSARDDKSNWTLPYESRWTARINTAKYHQNKEAAALIAAIEGSEDEARSSDVASFITALTQLQQEYGANFHMAAERKQWESKPSSS